MSEMCQYRWRSMQSRQSWRKLKPPLQRSNRHAHRPLPPPPHGTLTLPRRLCHVPTTVAFAASVTAALAAIESTGALRGWRGETLMRPTKRPPPPRRREIVGRGRRHSDRRSRRGRWLRGPFGRVGRKRWSSHKGLPVRTGRKRGD